MLRADAVIDVSGTWSSPNPAGANGLPAIGEGEAQFIISYGIPDVLGRDRARFAGQTVGVLGAGHSAIGTLTDLVTLAHQVPGTDVIWLLRGNDPAKAFGGGSNDKLLARGELGAHFASLVASGVCPSKLVSSVKPARAFLAGGGGGSTNYRVHDVSHAEEAPGLDPEDVLAGRVVDFGGVPTLVRAADPARARLASGFLRGLVPHPGPATLSLRYDSRRLELPGRDPDRTSDGIAVWYRRDTLWLRDADRGRARARDVDAVVVAGARDPAWGFRRLFVAAMTHMLARHDRFVLHGAAVAPDERSAHLVLGGSGAGKSTLAVAALRAGWHLLSDDMVVVREGRTGIEVAGLPRPVAVPADLASGVVGRVRAGDRRGRVELSDEVLVRGWFPVTAVIRVGHAESSRGELVPLAGRDALYAALGSFWLSLNPGLLRRFFPRAAALSRLPGWDLGHGCDPGTRLEAAARLLCAVR